MKLFFFRIIILCCLFFSYCITTLVPGFFYNSTAEHVYKDRVSSQLGSGRIIKMAKSCTYNSILLSLFYYGRPSTVENVAKEGQITQIGVVDYSSFSLFGPLFYSNCIIVWGDIE